MRRALALACVLLACVALAKEKYPSSDTVEFDGGVSFIKKPSKGGQAFCEDITTVPGTPGAGRQIMYCKAGAGWCAKDSTGTERCTGSGGGGFTPPLALADLTDATPADLCLRSGGASGDPVYEPCQPEIVVTDAPYNADNTGAADTRSTIQAALDQAASDCRNVRLPAGIYTIGYPGLKVQSCGGLGPGNRAFSIRGAGNGATYLRTPTSGTGFAMIASAQQTTCSGGTGDSTTCDDRFFSGTRGPGCPCDNNQDCQSGTCAGGASDRNFRFDDFAVQLRVDNTVGMDLTGLASTVVQNVSIFSSSLSFLNTIGLTGVGTRLASYYNTIIGGQFSLLEVCVLLGDNANAWTFMGTLIGSSCGSGLVFSGQLTYGASPVLSGALGNNVMGSTFQSTQTRVCGSPCTANTCCGGYFHGGTCASASDCREANIIDLGDQNRVIGNYFEDASTHVYLGCGAQAGGPCPSSDPASEPTMIGNAFYGASSGRIATGTSIAAGRPAYVLDRNNSGALTPLAFYGGGPWGPTTALVCTTANPGQAFYDTNCQKQCFCNGQPTPRYCRGDTGACGSSDTDCC